MQFIMAKWIVPHIDTIIIPPVSLFSLTIIIFDVDDVNQGHYVAGSTTNFASFALDSEPVSLTYIQSQVLHAAHHGKVDCAAH